MPGTIECFLLEPTTRYRVCLRRYSLKEVCAAKDWCHNADVYVGTEEHIDQPTCADDTVLFPHSDPRWPSTCLACGYAFVEEDYWQVNYEVVYIAADGREFTTVDKNSMTSDLALKAPPGAMWRAPWLEPKHAGSDGHSYILRTPGGDWAIDNGWTRTGVAPKLTANPSILCGKDAKGAWVYHGWLRNGRLEEC